MWGSHSCNQGQSPPGCSRWLHWAAVVPSRKPQLLGAGLAPPGSHNAWRSRARQGFPSPAAICSQPCLCPCFSPHSPQEHCPAALGCSSGVCLLRKSPGVLWDASEGRNPRIGSAGRRRRTPQGEIHVPNPLFDDLGAIIPFPLSSQGGHQEVEGFLSCRKKEVMTLIPP